MSDRENAHGWHRIVEQHIFLADVPRLPYRLELPLPLQAFAQTCIERYLRDERDGKRACGLPSAAEEGTVYLGFHPLYCCITVSGRTPGGHAAFDDHVGLHAKELWSPQHYIRQFPWFQRPDMLYKSMRNGWIDGVFSEIAQDSLVGVLGQDGGRTWASVFITFMPKSHLSRLHGMRHLPGARDGLADAAHAERIGGGNADGTQVVQWCFRRHCMWTYTVLSRQDILRERLVQS